MIHFLLPFVFFSGLLLARVWQPTERKAFWSGSLAALLALSLVYWFQVPIYQASSYLDLAAWLSSCVLASYALWSTFVTASMYIVPHQASRWGFVYKDGYRDARFLVWKDHWPPEWCIGGRD